MRTGLPERGVLYLAVLSKVSVSVCPDQQCLSAIYLLQWPGLPAGIKTSVSLFNPKGNLPVNPLNYSCTRVATSYSSGCSSVLTHSSVFQHFYTDCYFFILDIIWICAYLLKHILGTERAKTALHSPILYCLMTRNKALSLVSITLEECFSLHMIYSDRKSNFSNMIHCNLKWNQFNTDQLPRSRLHSALIGLDIFTCWWLFDMKRSETLRGFRQHHLQTQEIHLEWLRIAFVADYCCVAYVGVQMVLSEDIFSLERHQHVFFVMLDITCVNNVVSSFCFRNKSLSRSGDRCGKNIFFLCPLYSKRTNNLHSKLSFSL